MNDLVKSEYPRLQLARTECDQYDEPINSSAPQQLVTLAVDASGSMNGRAIEQVNQGMRDFARELCEDPMARATVQLQLLVFGGTVECHPFVPITRFCPPKLAAQGHTPLAEAMLKAIEGTDSYSKFLREAAEVDVLKPYYFLFSDGCPTSSTILLHEAAASVCMAERNRRGAFYAFGTDRSAIDGLQPLFVRPVHLLGENNFAQFFRILSASVRHISSRSTSEDFDVPSIIKAILRKRSEGNPNA